jgi:L-seryl-tRNA(Ser) seleniumtransferase
VPHFRAIPSIEQLRQRAEVAALEREHGRPATLEALRAAADALRANIAAGRTYHDENAVAAEIEARVAQRLQRERTGSLRAVINATGVIIHTNLGRAPLAAGAVQRVVDLATGYCNLEYDLARGSRGSRAVHGESWLPTLTGAEAGLVVNNNAAATMLILAALAAGREVVISRGELVEIGGGFRVPDVLAQSGAVLREVGTTNRTRIADYRAAIGPATAMLLRVHPSNFRIEGFTERPSLSEMVAAAREGSIPLVEDLGSGCIDARFDWEPTVQQSIAAGVDLVCFSGDKMLGGPQAGIVVGRKPLVERLQRHPLMRALRVDKLTLAALEGTLMEYRADRASASVPVARMLAMPADAVETRARLIAGRLPSPPWNVDIVSGSSAVGGGSAPGVQLPTVLLTLQHARLSPDALEERLRQFNPPVIARIENDRVVLDLRTVFEDQDDTLASALLTL